MADRQTSARYEQPPFQRFLPFYTLLWKEILRFFSVAIQTLITPVITASLYLLVFGLSLGSQISLYPDLSYVQFVVPGLILMGAVNNSFANTSSSIFFSRYIGNIVDLLVTPLTANQLLMAFILAGMIRGVLVGLMVLIVSFFFTSLPWVAPFAALGMLLLACFLFAVFGVVAAFYSSTFDHLSMYTNFLILPLIYTGGLFYPISHLPPLWQTISRLNPLTYLIDGFRQAIIGEGSTGLGVDFAVAGGISLALFLWAWWVIRSGQKLRN